MSKFKKYITIIGGTTVKESWKDAIALRESIKDEIDAIDRYTERANKSENLSVKNLLLDIAKEEKVHFGELEEMLEAVDPEHEPAEEEGEEEVNSGDALDDKRFKSNDLDESISGFGRGGTIQKFGNDIIISDSKQRSIQLSKQEVCDLLKKLKCYKK